MRTFLFVIFFATFPSLAIAEAGTFTIKGVGVSNVSGSIFINVHEEIEHTTCTKTKTFRLPAEGAEKTFREILSLAVTAKATGNSVSIGYDEDNCFASASVLEYIYLR